MSGRVRGGSSVPTSASSVSTPANRSRSRRNSNSSPLVSSVPRSRTVGASSAVGDSFTPSLLRGSQHRVADLGGAVAVLERGAVRPDLAVVADGGQQVVQLVDEGVLPADDVAGWPPVLPEWVIGLGDE